MILAGGLGVYQQAAMTKSIHIRNGREYEIAKWIRSGVTAGIFEMTMLNSNEKNAQLDLLSK
jgi:hypothetical protein